RGLRPQSTLGLSGIRALRGGGAFRRWPGSNVHGREGGHFRWRLPRGDGGVNERSIRVLALVADAFGGHGGVAQYNHDVLSALADCEGVASVTTLPRAAAADAGQLPGRLRQLAPVRGRLAYSLAALLTARRERPVGAVFCGHLFMAPLAAVIAKL